MPLLLLTRCKLHTLLLGVLEAEPLWGRVWLPAASTGAPIGPEAAAGHRGVKHEEALGMAWHMCTHGAQHLCRSGAGRPHKELQPRRPQARQELPAHLDIAHGVKAVHLVEQLQHGSLDLPLPT